MAVDVDDDARLLEEVRSQAGERHLERFSRADALALGRAALALAESGDLPVVVRVTRGDQIVFHAAREGTTAEHDDWVRRKTNSARLHEIPTLELVLRQRVSGRVADWLDPREYAVAGGAVPLVVAGGIAGVLAVSGLVGSVREDHDLAMAAVRALRGAGGTTAATKEGN
ncbi:heme-binding protein [Streptomyces xiamenensis]